MKIYQFVLVIFLFSFGQGMAQSAEVLQKAEDRVKNINAQIIAANPEVALSNEQSEKIKNLHIQRTLAINTVVKSDQTKEEKQKQIADHIRKFNQTVLKDILTPEQCVAKKEGQSLIAKE